MKYEGDSNTNGNWFAWNNYQTIGKETGSWETREQSETIQTAALLRSARIQRRALEF